MWLLLLLLHVWLSASLLLPFMLIILWAVRKWNWLKSRKWLWLVIWSGCGLVKMAAIGLLMGPNRYYDFGPLFGPQYWTLYLLRVALRLESWRTAWLFGILLGAIVEAALGCCLATLCWWLLQRVSRTGRLHGAFSAIERYSVSLLLPLCAFGIANNLNLWRPETCSDCFFPYRLPFTFFHEGGFAGGSGFVWRGIQWDISAMLVAGIVLGRVSSALAQRSKTTRAAI
jgi:hypothetical protein